MGFYRDCTGKCRAIWGYIEYGIMSYKGCSGITAKNMESTTLQQDMWIYIYIYLHIYIYTRIVYGWDVACRHAS